MSFQITAASSTRVTKSRPKNPLARRSSSGSPLAASRRSKSVTSTARRKASAAEDEDDDDLFSSRLEDHGLIMALATDLRLRDVPQQLRYSQEHMFEPIPEGGGFNSARISEVLIFRRNLPPVVTSAHIHALSMSPTATEREMAELLGKGVLRKITIPGRGVGRNNIGDCLVLTESWVTYVEQLPGLYESAKRKYIDALGDRPGRSSVSASAFKPAEATTLIKAGLLTASSTASGGASGTFGLDPGSTGTLASLSTAGSRAAAGSMEAVGGAKAFLNAGGGNGALSGPSKSPVEYGPQLNFSLPSMGPYLRLLESARAHLVALLSKSKYKEAPKDLLRERWDGAPSKKDWAGKGKGLEGVVLPVKTKKWRQFNGLKFQWILEECLGTGLVEVFETGSVGQGIRLT